MVYEEWNEFKNKCKNYGLVCEPNTLEKLAIYKNLVEKWNQTVNLYSRKEVDHLVRRHFEDSLPLAAGIRKNGDLIDVGSGGGFPGMVVAVLRKDVKATLLEPKIKKAVFLREVKRRLHLENIEIFEERIEEFRNKPKYSDAVSRAVFSPEKWVQTGMKILQRDGILWLMLSLNQADLFTKKAEKKLFYELDQGRKRVLLGIRKEILDE